MDFKSLIKYIAMSILLSSPGAYGQSIRNIAGQYKVATTLLVIEPDNTFLMVDMGTLEKGIVTINGDNGKLIFNKPKELFTLYGRTRNSITTGNIINYKSGKSEARPLINYDEHNNELKKMKKVFNDDANCLKQPTLINNPHNNPKFYFSVQDSKEVYEFENNQGYNDFVVLYRAPRVATDEIKFAISEDGKSIVLQDLPVKKLSKPNISQEEIKELFGMYDRAFGESAYYYCNPAYNTFEESGIHLEEFDKVQESNEYYFKNKTIEPADDSDYHDYGIIYEYKKINPVILKDRKYTLDAVPVFNFTCDHQ